ncbi:phosphatase PAP2 family protein [Patescibacteria group bacterium]|nr:phosphatase PAP2 family protein [Patescibacteria group bacterium]
MLNWWLIAVLIFFTLIGFFYLDKLILKFTEQLRKKFHPIIDEFFRAISFTPFVVFTLYIIPTIFVFFKMEDDIVWFSIAALTLACLLATGLAFVMKYIFKRVRPLGNTTYLGKIDSAFPSAHTAGSFVAAFTIAIFWPAWSVLFLTLAFLVAVSRMYLELHFFSDVMGGVLLAYLMVILALDSQILIFLGL